MTDRYTKIVLTVIAAALVYLCIVMTPFPVVNAQGTRKAGEMITTPIEAVIVGWKATGALPIMSAEPLRVQTERATGAADRVVIAGWEENATRDRATTAMSPVVSSRGKGLPVHSFQ
ncbi:MAG TPA: hypothetical protein VM096_20360 [Vicinamibacterales bacterium]|nr:hypothetical protein [Vicinamibacterales bacterium]